MCADEQIAAAIDRNTYRPFDLERGVPTDAYALDDAMNDGFLVPARAVAVPLKFQREGVNQGTVDRAKRLVHFLGESGFEDFGGTSNYAARGFLQNGYTKLPTIFFKHDSANRCKSLIVKLVRKRGLEPPRDCSRQPLKLVRLPIPPFPRQEPEFRLDRPSSISASGDGVT